MNCYQALLYYLSPFLLLESSSGLEQLVITLLSQNHPYHVQQAAASKAALQNACISQNISHPIIHLAHEDFLHTHYWTIFPLLPILSKRHGQNASWFLFGTENMNVQPTDMAMMLSKLDPKQDLFLGRTLRDQEATIIHHFAFHEDPAQFAYPDLAGGLLLSAALLNRLARRYSRLDGPPADFSIDPMHELALFVWQEGAGVPLTDPGALCVEPAAGCATFQRAPASCEGRVRKSDVHFAVKTCSKFHDSRLPVVRDTWAKDATNIRYYSDVADGTHGTVAVGVRNTERGHCAKTLRILQLAAAEPGLRWLAVVDDDTLLSVPRLLEVLACYSPDDPLMLGERYGFRTSGRSGYSYITGGGGMVLSVEAVRRLTASSGCRCPSADTPDDMHLGMCAGAAGVTLIHSDRFHQARPPDYPADVLARSRPVSFHKHWMIDPRRVYRSWLRERRPGRAAAARTEL